MFTTGFTYQTIPSQGLLVPEKRKSPPFCSNGAPWPMLRFPFHPRAGAKSLPPEAVDDCKITIINVYPMLSMLAQLNKH